MDGDLGGSFLLELVEELEELDFDLLGWMSSLVDSGFVDGFPAIVCCLEPVQPIGIGVIHVGSGLELSADAETYTKKPTMYLGGTSLSGDFLRSLVYSMSMREAELDVDVDEPLDEVEDWALNPASEGVRDKLYLHRCRLANLDKLSLDITDLDEFVDTRESMTTASTRQIRERCHDVAFVKAQLSREVTSLWAAFGNKLNQVVGKRQTTRTFGRGVYVNLLQSLEPVNAFTLRLNERIELMELCRTRIQSGLRVTAKWKKHLGQAEEAWSHIPTSTLDEESQNVFLSPSAFHDYDNCANTAAEVKGRMLASFVRSQASAALEAVNEAIENDKKLLAIRDIMGKGERRGPLRGIPRYDTRQPTTALASVDGP
ncbi:MAG: LOW QUALITY PROTEIN: uncharacterized protein KVP18_001976 [Porospora cf. gigantea A]|uniref:uncharacterized protein n=1 Tax=Porospora cf. gigantea A TaxID=2853593 RepID=UPI00355A8582|nr:MAG: LOW QUALITY PROTEIN: hypothetical protein KVP18_001976 [Porospora cf. gigantea A]